MKYLFFALFLLAGALLFFLLDKLVKKNAYSLGNRYLHIRLILAILLAELVFANVYTVVYPLKLLDWIINSTLLATFFQVVLPNRAYELIYLLLVLFGLNLMMTLLVLLTIGITKFLFRRKTTFVDIDNYYGFGRVIHWPWLLVRWFYEEENGQFHLNSRGFSMGLWVKGMKKCFLLLWGAETLALAFSTLWGNDGWNTTLSTLVKSWYLLPMAAYLLTEQIQFFLEGVDDQEAGTFGSAEIDERLEGDMCVLSDYYQTTFQSSGALLYSEYGSDQSQRRDGLSSNDLGNQQIADCAHPDILNMLANQLRECGVQQCDSYQNALVELLGGHSINVRDHSQGEFLIYLAAYLNFFLSQGKTALVLCKDNAQAQRLCQSIRDALRRLNSLYSVWNLSTIQDADENSSLSLLVCSFEELRTSHVMDKRSDFAGDLFCAVIADGFQLFRQDSVHLEFTFNELRKATDLQQYVLFTDEDNDGIRTAMEGYTGQELTPFHNDVRLPKTNLMVWKEESCYKLQCLIGVGDSLSPYLGVAIPLALLAAKHDLPQIYVIPQEDRGDLSYWDVLSMSSKAASSYLERRINLKSVIRYQPGEALEKQDLSMIVAYDTDYNILNAMWRWMKYGGSQSTLLHVISPPYLLREYFAAGLSSKQLLLKNNEFDALIPYTVGMRQSRLAVLLVGLCDHGMTEQELLERAKSVGLIYHSAEEVLWECLQVVLVREELHNPAEVYEYFHFQQEKTFLDDGFRTQTRITTSNPVLRGRLSQQTAYANLYSQGNLVRQLPILSGNLTNYYLQDQLAAFDGYLYRIQSVQNGSLYAVQELAHDVPQYLPVSVFHLDHVESLEPCVDSGDLSYDLCAATVSREIIGYWSTNCGNDFVGGRDVQMNLLSQWAEERTKTLERASVLKLSIRRDALGQRSEQASLLLAYLLGELSKTLFPATHQNLYAAVTTQLSSEQLANLTSKELPAEDKIRSIIPTVSVAESDLDRVEIYLIEFSCMEYGMVQMLYQRRKQVLLMVEEYLKWYLESNDPSADSQAAPHGTYLNFGGDCIPDLFAPQELLTLCQSMAPQHQIATAEPTAASAANGQTCTFCGRPALFTINLSDGRCMCGHCKNHQITQRDEIKSLFQETVAFLEKGYHICLRKNIHVRFQSADTIAMNTGGIPNGRILGYYSHLKHQLCLEGRGPRVAMQSTLIHELTHCWQYSNLDLKRMSKKLPRVKREQLQLRLLEGHAVYVEIDAMRRMNETEYANRLEETTRLRQDEYGQGFLLIYDYIRQKAEEGSHMTPFAAMEALVDDIIEGTVSIS